MRKTKRLKTMTEPWSRTKPTAVLVLADGTVIEGTGAGATGAIEAEVCFNTALTGYQEILTDPSYLGQIVTFTFPHIGNIGANDEDIEDLTPAARRGAVGAIFKADITNPSNYRSAKHFDEWLKARGIIAMTGIDTRALTAWIRDNGIPNAVIAHDPDGKYDIDALNARARAWSGLESPRPGPRSPGFGTTATATARPTRRMWSPSTSASNATSCASSPVSTAR